MSSDDLQTLVHQFYSEVVNQGSREAADRLLSPDFIDHGAQPKDRKAFMEFLAELSNAFPDIQLEVTDLFTVKEKAAARVRVSGTQKGPFAGSPGTGRSVVWTGVDIFRFENGRIAERWNYRDLLGLYSQLGILENPMTSYICVKGASEAIDFYKAAFNAEEVERILDENGRVSHAELRVRSARIFLADEHPEIDFLSPASLGGSAVLLHLEVPDPDALFNQAVSAGASVTRPMADQGGGLRNGKLVDPFGHTWMISRK
jgi:PhnB protein